jgi:catechol 2,3-dioxygenase-like lactoylglutathione lyase family enzyme
MMPGARLDLVVVVCHDIERMKTFYRDLMRFVVSAEEAEWVEFCLDETRLALRPFGREYDRLPAQGNVSTLQLAFRVGRDDVDVCHEHLMRRGVEIVEAPINQSWGHRTLFVRDPEGNLIEIFAEL